MDTLILDMLELAKFESGTYKMKKSSFYIDTVVKIYVNIYLWK